MRDILGPSEGGPRMTKKRNYVGRITKPCEVCGALVERQASQFRQHVFCSKACYWGSPYRAAVVADANTRRFPAGAVLEKQCEYCGSAVRRFRSQFNGRTFCSRECRQKHRTKNAARQITSSGYVKVFIGRGLPGADSHGHILEHRKVIQDFLGRPLLPNENVHHRNGDRTDNRLGNLELWNRSQPPGQRVEDKLAWARALIAQYEGTPLA